MTPPSLHSPSPRVTFGAYALTPGPDSDDGRGEQTFYAGLAELPIEVIEFPLAAPGSASLSPEWIGKLLQPEWDLMVTCIPRTMQRLGQTPAYGLASTDADGRTAALADIAEVRYLAAALAQKSGRARVAAIEIHSAPGPERGSVAAFTESLAELLTWDFSGAELIVEHCDALLPGQVAEKGFLTLGDEIAAVRAAVGADSEVSADADAAASSETGAAGGSGAAAPTRLGIGINWGRSAIEGRSSATPAEHIEMAAQAGLLRSLIFSGAAASASPWGAPWSDAHIPPRGEDAAPVAAVQSLLTAAEIEAAYAAARGADLAFAGPKITAEPGEKDVATRLALARAALAQTTSSGRGA